MALTILLDKDSPNADSSLVPQQNSIAERFVHSLIHHLATEETRDTPEVTRIYEVRDRIHALLRQKKSVHEIARELKVNRKVLHHYITGTLDALDPTLRKDIWFYIAVKEGNSLEKIAHLKHFTPDETVEYMKQHNIYGLWQQKIKKNESWAECLNSLKSLFAHPTQELYNALDSYILREVILKKMHRSGACDEIKGDKIVPSAKVLYAYDYLVRHEYDPIGGSIARVTGTHRNFVYHVCELAERPLKKSKIEII